MGMQLEDSRLAVVEIKTASNRTFEKSLDGKIDIAYLAQSWFYHYATGFQVVIFIFYRKETSHICEVVFDVEQKETIVMRRYGNDAYAMAVNDPMLIAEVKTPFDAAVEAQGCGIPCGQSVNDYTKLRASRVPRLLNRDN
jgi:hypothetical protein